MVLGACYGDAIGARYEHTDNAFNMTLDEFREYMKTSSHDSDKILGTDDSLMTIAVMEALNANVDEIKAHEVFDTDWQSKFKADLTGSMVRIGRAHIDAGFGGMFYKWILSNDHKPYGSWGNGSAMRVSPVGWASNDGSEVKELAKLTADVSHDCLEGERGAQAIAYAVMTARHKFDRFEEYRKTIMQDILTGYTNSYYDDKSRSYRRLYYDLYRTVDKIIDDGYGFEVSCPKSVPEALCAFFDPSTTDYVSAVYNAIRMNSDTDTQAAMAGGIAAAYYGMPKELMEDALDRIRTFDPRYVDIYNEFKQNFDVDESLRSE